MVSCSPVLFYVVAESRRVARVVYFSRAATGALQAHLSWLQRATQTWLGSVAPPLLLFYGDWCSSEPGTSYVLSSVRRGCS